MVITKNIKIFLLLFILLYLFLGSPLISSAAKQSCSSKYPDDGKCIAECPEGFSEDQGTSLCSNTSEKCCHEYAATTSLRLQIPLLTYTTATSIYEYIGNIYTVALYVIIPIAIVVIIFAGIQWASSAGSPEKIKASKMLLLRAFIGLGIALFSYVLLSVVGITQISGIDVKYIEEIESGDIDFPEPGDFSISAAGVVPGDIYCPGSGGYSAMEQVAKSSVGRVTYRLGGKAWNRAPYRHDSKNCGSQSCKSFCPSGTICLDCSGYVSFVYKCVGLKGPPSYTGTMFGCNCGSSEKIKSLTATSVNGKALQPGDYVGYPSGCNHGMGHVYIYAGNGTIYESHGGGGTSNARSGRHPGKAILGTPFERHKWIGAGKPKCIKRRL